MQKGGTLDGEVCVGPPCVDNAREGFGELFDTHPSIDSRVATLVKFAGGHDPGPLAHDLDVTLRQLLALAESYPDVKASTNIQQLQTRIMHFHNSRHIKPRHGHIRPGRSRAEGLRDCFGRQLCQEYEA
jgi:LemA family